MSEDNSKIISFPHGKIKNGKTKKKPKKSSVYANNLVSKTSPAFWQKKQQKIKNLPGVYDDNFKSPPAQASAKKNDVIPFTPAKETQAPAEEAKKKKKHLWLKPAFGAGFLCMVLLPLAKNINPPAVDTNHPISQGIRITASDTEKDIKEKINHRLKAYKKDSHKALQMIRTGRREIASLGITPNIRERLLHGLLQSRYEVDWKRRKIQQVRLIEGKEPVKIPGGLQNLVRNYKTLFPKHDHFTENDTSLAPLESYSLKRNNRKIVEIQMLTDQQGRLLSLSLLK